MFPAWYCACARSHQNPPACLPIPVHGWMMPGRRVSRSNGDGMLHLGMGDRQWFGNLRPGQLSVFAAAVSRMKQPGIAANPLGTTQRCSWQSLSTQILFKTGDHLPTSASDTGIQSLSKPNTSSWLNCAVFAADNHAAATIVSIRTC